MKFDRKSRLAVRPPTPRAPGLLWVAAAALALGGCAVGPDFETPAAPATPDYLPGGALAPGVRRISAAAPAASPESWWRQFGSAKLAALIEEALVHNPDLQAASAAVRVAQANAAVQSASLFPSLTAGFAPTRQGNPKNTLDTPAASGSNVYSVHTAQVTVAYAPDVFGGVRRSIESAEALAENRVFQQRGVELTLAANVALAAVQEASLRAQIAVTRRMIHLQGDLLGVLQRQLRAGQIAEPDVLAQETAIAQARLLLPPLERQLDQQRNLLAALTGRFPSEGVAHTFDFSAFRGARPVPLVAPADLVRQRPDIRAAEANLRAANADVGVAIANRLPSITLTAQAGSSAAALGSLFTPGAAMWSLAGGVLQPIFDAGALKNRQIAAEAAFEQSSAQYRATLLVAFQNVADVLRALQADARSIAAAQAAEDSAARNIALIRKQIELGQMSLPILLAAQQAYLQTSLARVQAQASRYANTIALMQALGGGWWNRTAPAPPPTRAAPTMTTTEKDSHVGLLDVEPT
ncbi:MAG: ttgC [Hyphomicrobiales bacterium]|nr:ttgC [Hyphomicrobiales bacterium]